MKIIDDKLIFDAADFAEFSSGVQKALIFYVGPNLSPETAVIDAFNAAVQSAVSALKAVILRDLSPLVAALAVETDPAKLANVETLLDQAKIVLEIPVSLVPVVA